MACRLLHVAQASKAGMPIPEGCFGSGIAGENLNGYTNKSCETTPRGFEPLRAEPNGFRVHFLNRSDTLSLCQVALIQHRRCLYPPQGKRGLRITGRQPVSATDALRGIVDMGEGGFNGQGEPITALGRVLTIRHTSSPTGVGERRILGNECGVSLTIAIAIIYNRQWVWCGWKGLPINLKKARGAGGEICR